jgi:hypothetical protein
MEERALGTRNLQSLLPQAGTQPTYYGVATLPTNFNHVRVYVEPAEAVIH